VGSSDAASPCVVKPELTEGPFFVDEKLQRSDIRSDPASGAPKAGVPLALAFRVGTLRGGSCAALAGATVDVWHCDAGGVYSDEATNGTTGQKFLRGYQVTNADGAASFATIFPGWYQGRAVHIHFKIRTKGSEFTSQLFFDDAVAVEIHSQPPYAARGPSPMKNASDSIYRSAGRQLLLPLTREGDGYRTTFDVALR
jgi:protocatechuate 3,4-dioxygenase beta subunit